MFNWTISYGLCWNIDSRKRIWRPRAHFGSENESLNGLTWLVCSHFIFMLTGFCIEGFNNFGESAESFQVSDVKDLIKDMVVSGQSQRDSKR